MTTEETTPVAPDCRSTIYEKIAPEVRRKLDRAILNYDPASYLAIFKKFDVPSHGVSYTAFYNYARRLRGRDSMRQLLDHPDTDDDSLVEALPRLIAQFLVEQIVANDRAGADTIYRLTLAHRAALENSALVQKLRRAAASSAHSPPASAVAGRSVPRPSESGAPSPNKAAHPLDSLSDDELLALANRVQAHRQSLADADRSQLAEDMRRTQEKLRAAGDHQSADQLERDITALMSDKTDEKQLLESPWRPPPADSTSIAVQPPPPAAPSSPESLNPSVPKSLAPSPPQSLNPSVPQSLASSDALTSTAADELRQTPEDRRRNEFLRVMTAFGLMKECDGPRMIEQKAPGKPAVGSDDAPNTPATDSS